MYKVAYSDVVMLGGGKYVLPVWIMVIEVF